MIARIGLPLLLLVSLLGGLPQPDAVAGATICVSVARDGAEGDSVSNQPAIAAGGRFVVFESAATNLAGPDENHVQDVFVHDRYLYQTTRVSNATDGAAGNGYSGGRTALSADGRYRVFSSAASNLIAGDDNGMVDVFLHDGQTGVITRVSVASSGAPGNGHSENPDLAAGGAVVVYASAAANLVAGDSNGATDIFAFDRATAETTLISQDAQGNPGNGASFSPALSAGGRWVAFISNATNLVAGDTNGVADVFVHDRQTGQTIRASVGAPGHEGNGGVNPDSPPAISDDGRFVAFSSAATNLVEGDSNEAADIFVRDVEAGTTARVSVASGGVQANMSSFDPALSGDGQFVTFHSDSDNLVSGDTNHSYDVFLHDRATGVTSRVSVDAAGQPLAGKSSEADISSDGRFIVYSYLPELFAPINATRCRLFVHDRAPALSAIGGVIVDSQTQQPLPDVTVTAPGGHLARTGSDGRYLLSGLTERLYTITPRLRGYTFTPASRQVAVPPTATEQSFSGAPIPTFAVAGTVVDAASGDPIPDAVVSAGIGQATRTDELGRYQLAGLPAGPYTLSAWKEGFDFSPLAVDVAGPPDVAGQNFSGAALDTLHVQLGEAITIPLEQQLPNLCYLLSNELSLSAGGRFVSFATRASTLVEGDTNLSHDVFAHDLLSGQTVRGSVDSFGAQANNHSNLIALSPHAQWLVFGTTADNLVAGQTPNSGDVMLHDLRTGQTERLLAGGGAVAVSSPAARYLAFTAILNSDEQVYVLDRQTGQTELISAGANGNPGNNPSRGPFISADGRFVAFYSFASNLIAGDTNETQDVFVYDRLAGAFDRVSVDSQGNQSHDVQYHVGAHPVVSDDGRFVAFISEAGDLVGGDTNEATDVFVHDRVSGATVRVSVDSAGQPGEYRQHSEKVSMSADGRFIVFSSSATLDGADTSPRADVYLRDRHTGKTILLSGSEGNQDVVPCSPPVISRDGRTVAFFSNRVEPPAGAGGRLAAATFDSEVLIRPVAGGRPPATRFLSTTATITLGRRTFTNADILAYTPAGNSWDVLYDGSYARTPKNLSAFAFDGDDLLLGFSVAQTVPGLGRVAPQDLVRFAPTALGYNSTTGVFAPFFDGSDVGLSATGEVIDALWRDAAGRLYLSVSGAGEVLSNPAAPTSARIRFQDEDVLRFTPSSTGATTAGAWELYWDPTLLPKMAAEDVNGYWEDPANGDRYVTIQGAFSIGSAPTGGVFSGNGTTILRFAPNAAAPGGWAPAAKVAWLAAGATLPRGFNLDGIELAR